MVDPRRNSSDGSTKNGRKSFERYDSADVRSEKGGHYFHRRGWNTGLVNWNDRSSYVAIVDISIGRRLSRLFDVEFYHQINLRCRFPKRNHFNINGCTTNRSVFEGLKDCNYKIPNASGRYAKMYRRMCSNGVPWSTHICVQSGACAGAITGAEGWIHNEATCTRDHQICAAK